MAVNNVVAEEIEYTNTWEKLMTTASNRKYKNNIMYRRNVHFLPGEIGLLCSVLWCFSECRWLVTQLSSCWIRAWCTQQHFTALCVQGILACASAVPSLGTVRDVSVKPWKAWQHLVGKRLYEIIVLCVFLPIHHPGLSPRAQDNMCHNPYSEVSPWVSGVTLLVSLSSALAYWVSNHLPAHWNECSECSF